MKKPADKRFANVITLAQLVLVCKEMKGKSLKESLAIGKKAVMGKIERMGLK